MKEVPHTQHMCRGYVYMAQMLPYTKIGMTHNTARKRVAQIARNLPNDLTLVAEWPSDYPSRLERTLHIMLKWYQHKGEWYILPPKVSKALLRIGSDGWANPGTCSRELNHHAMAMWSMSQWCYDELAGVIVAETGVCHAR